MHARVHRYPPSKRAFVKDLSSGRWRKREKRGKKEKKRGKIEKREKREKEMKKKE